MTLNTMLRPLSRGGLALFAILSLALTLACRDGRESSEETAVPAPPPAPVSLPTPRHVVIYLVDTLRSDRMSLYGYGAKTTPYLDRLAAESVVFDEAYAPAPWTLPSVASLITSTHPCEHGVVVERRPLTERFPTLAERLGRAGLYTAAFSANVYTGDLAGLNRGYTVYNPVPIDRVAGALPETIERPLFLYMHTVEPHNVYDVPAVHEAPFGVFEKALKDAIRRRMLGYRQLTAVDWRERRVVGSTDNSPSQAAAMRALEEVGDEFRALYDASIHWADENLRQLVEALEARGVWDETLFIALSDHGEEMGDHGGWLHDQSVYEELARVPLLVRLPGGALGGTRVNEPVSLLDIGPTIMDLLGRPDLTEGMRGESLVGRMTGKASLRPGDASVVSMRINRKKYYRPYKETRGDVNVAVRVGGFKGIMNVEPRTVELYDLELDPGETVDVAGRFPEIASRVRTEAREVLGACTGSADLRPEEGGLEGIDEKTLEGLRALGYID